MGMDIKKVFEAANNMLVTANDVTEQMSADTIADLGVNLSTTESDLVSIGQNITGIYGTDPDDNIVTAYANATNQESNLSRIMSELESLMNKIMSNSYSASVPGNWTNPVDDPNVEITNDNSKQVVTSNTDLNEALSSYNKKKTISDLDSKTDAYNRASAEIDSLLNDMKTSMLANTNLDSEIINKIITAISVEYKVAIVASKTMNLISTNFDSLIPFGITITKSDDKFKVSVSQVKIANKVKEAYIAEENQQNQQTEQNKINGSLSQYYVGRSLQEKSSYSEALTNAKNEIMSILDNMKSSMQSAGLDRMSVDFAINDTKIFYTSLINDSGTSSKMSSLLSKNGIQVNETEIMPTNELLRGTKKYVVLLDVGSIADKVKSQYNNDATRKIPKQ